MTICNKNPSGTSFKYEMFGSCIPLVEGQHILVMGQHILVKGQHIMVKGE